VSLVAAVAVQVEQGITQPLAMAVLVGQVLRPALTEHQQLGLAVAAVEVRVPLVPVVLGVVVLALQASS
jgi:hypothetical protein